MKFCNELWSRESMGFVWMYCILSWLQCRSHHLVGHISFCMLKMFTLVLMLPCKYLLNLSWKKRLKGIDLEEQSFFYWLFWAFLGFQCCRLCACLFTSGGCPRCDCAIKSLTSCYNFVKAWVFFFSQFPLSARKVKENVWFLLKYYDRWCLLTFLDRMKDYCVS